MSRFMKVRQYSFLEFDPKLLCLGVQLTEFASEAKPVGYKEVVNTFGKTRKLQAALNGPMAGWSKSDKWKGVQEYDRTQSMFLESACFEKDLNLSVAPTKVGPHGGMTLGIRQQTTGTTVTTVGYAEDGWVKDDTTIVALQLPFSLVINGKPTKFLTSGNLSERTGRPALGLLKNGNLILGGGYGSCVELTTALIEVGAKRAGYLDGGGSYHFLVAHHQEHNASGEPSQPLKNDFYGPTKDRPTPSWVLVLSESDDQVLV